MMAGWGGGEGMVPERRQEHVPYLYSLSYLATQCINNINRVPKCKFTLRCMECQNARKLLVKMSLYMISIPLIQKYILVCHPDN